jgi:hypothetical protein
MGFHPQAVRAMSMFQYFAAVDGFMKANSPDDQKSLSDKEKDDLFAWIEGS